MNKITIKNEKGRLSKEEIDRMVNEAEKFKDDDERQKEKVTARNQLENYAFNVRQALNEYGEKLSADDKAKAQKAVDDSLKWIENNGQAEKDEYEYRLKELEIICSSIMSKLHQQSGNNGQQQPAGQNCGDQYRQGQQGFNGPTVEEVD